MTIGNLFGVFEGPELLILLLIVLLLFGGTKLPGLARSLGQAKREFQDAATTPPPVGSPPAPETDTVSISRDEVERLRAAAERHPTDAGGSPSAN